MITVRELYDEAVEKGAEDYEIICAEEGEFYGVSNVRFETSEKEVKLS